MLKKIFQRDIPKHALKIINRSCQKRRLTSQTRRHPAFERSPVYFKEEEVILNKLIPQIREDVIDESLVYYNNMQKLRRHFENLFTHQVENLKSKYMPSAAITINFYKHFKKDYTEEELMKVGILGWCFKLQDISLIMVDDIMDESEFRYNKPVWYREVGVKQAIIDSLIFEHCSSYLLLKYFSDLKYFPQIQKELLQNIATANSSQILELDDFPLEDYEKYENLVKSYPFFVHSVTSVMYMVDVDDPHLHSIAKKMCMDISIFGKRYDDITAIVETVSVAEKHNTDIHFSRATWMAIQVSKLGNPQQKKTFKEHYGSSDPKSALIIFDIYKELKLVEHFDKYTMEYYDDMYTQIQNLPPQLPKEFFSNMLDLSVANKFYA
ncbi:farnesyl pyrophosphate synthase-like isoform X2 [Diabrotica virgifera virgifera]|uniref:Farnesyl pyrophosphate synthase-like n=1 Tax=Diabrotica virgifera virgifera TaxID=50390 RepID=A0ABM5L4N5_DIAVI|nr:farnesyl pyrophosphate synthase-like isoform X2 [Diabrotica virgifera virgifera]